MSDNSVVMHSLDDYFQSTPLGSIERAIGNNLFGINHQQTPNAVPMNKDHYGLTFFVRPQLNLQSDNVRNVRLFYPLLTTNDQSIQRFVRNTLDPRLAIGANGPSSAIDCPFVDPEQAFIPILTNNLNSLSGWPDITAPIFSSKAGLYGEVYAQVDGTTKNFSEFTIDATFRNTRGDPILYLFYIWLHYQSLVFEGLLMPYPDYIIENMLDYNSRVYRLVLDPSKRFVRKIAACGVMFPMNVPAGAFFDYSSEKPYNDQSKDITIRFQCLGAQYMDDILIDEFNKTVQIFNAGMRDENRSSMMMKINASLLSYFNNRGYPRINPDNYELEWYVSAEYFNQRISAVQQTQLYNPLKESIQNSYGLESTPTPKAPSNQTNAEVLSESISKASYTSKRNESNIGD